MEGETYMDDKPEKTDKTETDSTENAQSSSKLYYKVLFIIDMLVVAWNIADGIQEMRAGNTSQAVTNFAFGIALSAATVNLWIIHEPFA